MFNDRSILVTGGTGSFGRKFIATVLQRYKPRRVIVYSRTNSSSTKCSRNSGRTKCASSSATCATANA